MARHDQHPGSFSTAGERNPLPKILVGSSVRRGSLRQTMRHLGQKIRSLEHNLSSSVCESFGEWPFGHRWLLCGLKLIPSGDGSKSVCPGV